MQAYATAKQQATAFETAREKLEEMVGYLESRASLCMTHDELEAYVVKEGRELQRRMLQEHFWLRGAAERPVRVVDAEGVEMKERRTSARTLRSLVGDVVVARLLYQFVGREGLCPQDAALNLPDEKFSLGVRRRVAEEVACGSFDHAVERLGATTGASVAKLQVEELARRACVDFAEFYTARPVDKSAEDGKLLVLTFDMAGIVVRMEDLREQTRRAAQAQASDSRWPPKRLSKGQKRNRKRMAQVAAIYAVERHVREAQDVVRELRPVQDTTPSKARPKPVNKQVWASVELEPAQVINRTFAEALKRDPQRQRQWVVVVDGQETQLELVHAAARTFEVNVTVILDVMHVLEYLWEAAHCFHQDGSPEAEQWVTRRLVMLLEGADPSQVAAGIRRSATLQGVHKRKGVDKCARYLCKYRKYARYGDAIGAGLPIATGIIEGACRHLVRDRMDRTGARWSTLGAEAVLKLRALRLNGDFDAYWRFHVRAHYERTHVPRYADGIVPNPVPARPHLRTVK